MEPINFIKSVLPHEHYALVRWYRISLSLLALVISGIMIVQSMQCVSWYTARNDLMLSTQKHASIKGVLQQQELLQQRYAALKKRVDILTSMSDQLKKPLHNLTIIKQALGSCNQLQTCSLNNTSFTVTVQCPSGRAAQAVFNTLSQEPYFAALKLASLQHNGNAKMYTACIKGGVKSVT